MFRKIVWITMFAGIMGANLCLAADPEAGKSAAAACAGCHGAKGISATGAFPNLAGQKTDYLSAQLKAFRSKTRANAIMGPMAASLKDDDIDNLAAYFSSLKACE